MKEKDKGDLSNPDISVYAKAKMKRVHMIECSEVEVEQYSNRKHVKLHQSIRINAPDELEDGETYKNATVGTIRNVIVKEPDK